jgi:NAD(P)-dependent dehydrogenase (short-subunit alcohol dehydrogenase family)
MLNFTTI